MCAKAFAGIIEGAVGRGRSSHGELQRTELNFLRQILCQALADLQTAKLIRADLDLTFEANALSVKFNPGV